MFCILPSHVKLFCTETHAGGGGGVECDNPIYFQNSLPKELKIFQAIRRLLKNFRKDKMDEIPFVLLPWQLANVQVPFAHFGLKQPAF